MWLLVGLGNPGKEYEATRHNVGFRVVDLVAARAGAPTSTWRNKWGADLAEIKLGSERVLLCKPMEFMNVSGQPVTRVASFYKVEPSRTVVVHDDLDLPFTRMKLGQGGGHGGNNGVRSILTEWGTADFHRVRVGIGRPAGGRDASGWVLGGFSEAERQELGTVLERAADAASAIITDGGPAAMNRFNGKADKQEQPIKRAKQETKQETKKERSSKGDGT